MSRELWDAMKRALWVRAKGRCEVPWCPRTTLRLDPHHVVKRSAGGEDSLRNLALLCAVHHAETDNPYALGRLLVTMVEGPEMWMPKFQTVYAVDKHTARTARALSVGPNGDADGTRRAAGRFPRQRDGITTPVVMPRSVPIPTVPRGRR